MPVTVTPMPDFGSTPVNAGSPTARTPAKTAAAGEGGAAPVKTPASLSAAAEAVAAREAAAAAQKDGAAPGDAAKQDPTPKAGDPAAKQADANGKDGAAAGAQKGKPEEKKETPAEAEAAKALATSKARVARALQELQGKQSAVEKDRREITEKQKTFEATQADTIKAAAELSEIRQLAETDPLAAISRLGLDYKRLTAEALSGKESTAESKEVKELKAELAKVSGKLEELTAGTKEKEAEITKKAQEAVQKRILSNINSQVDKSEHAALFNAYGVQNSEDYVLRIMQSVQQQTGEWPSIPEAVKAAGKRLREHFESQGLTLKPAETKDTSKKTPAASATEESAKGAGGSGTSQTEPAAGETLTNEMQDTAPERTAASPKKPLRLSDLASKVQWSDD